MSKPKNWQYSLQYLSAPVHSRELSASQHQTLKTRPSAGSATAAIPIIPASSTPIPNPLIRIQVISDPEHPADGQCGLFATRDLKPGTFILPYLGRVHDGATGTDPESDYDLWLDREAGIAVDAARQGNEGRFVNDYRGVRQRHNAEFGTAWCERWGQLCVGFWAMGLRGKRGKQEGIRKGEEILVSYGKGFWENREEEDHEPGEVLQTM